MVWPEASDGLVTGSHCITLLLDLSLYTVIRANRYIGWIVAFSVRLAQMSVVLLGFLLF
jgi:hypothetical protein